MFESLFFSEVIPRKSRNRVSRNNRVEHKSIIGEKIGNFGQTNEY